MTEEEAKTKWCPFARVPSGEPAAAVNRPEPYDDVPKCLGSFCMAWRWDAPTITRKRNLPGSISTGDEGFCGLAGPPMTPADNMELVEIVARALEHVHDIQMTDGMPRERRLQAIGFARIALTAIEASGRRIVPVEPTPAISRLSVGMSTTHEMARITFSPPLPR